MRSAKAPRRIVMGLILLLGASTVSRADFGALPLKVGEIREARQNVSMIFGREHDPKHTQPLWPPWPEF